MNRSTVEILEMAIAEHGTLRPGRRALHPVGSRGHRCAVWGAIWTRAEARGWVRPRPGERRPRTPPFLPPEGITTRIVAVVWWALARRARAICADERDRGYDGLDSAGDWGANAEVFERICVEARGRPSVAAQLARLSLVPSRRRQPTRCELRDVPAGIGRLSATRRRYSICGAQFLPVRWALTARAAAVIGAAELWERVLLLVEVPLHARGAIAQICQGELDYSAVARARALIARVPAERREVVALGLAARALHDSCAESWEIDQLRRSLIRAASGCALDGAPWGWLRSGDPESVWAALRFAGGTPAQELAPGLSRAEFQRWLRAPRAMRPEQFLLWESGLEGLCRSDTTLPVARWVVAVHRDPERRAALYAERTIRHDNQEFRYQFVSRLDEIREEDLPQGEATGVVVAFERAAERFTAAQLEKFRNDHRLLRSIPSWASRLPSFARLLLTPSELVREGDEMHHCVGKYVHSVASGASTVVALAVRGQRSTVEFKGEEIDPAGIIQHRSFYNGAPHPVCARALRALIRWIQRAQRRRCR